MIVFLSIMVAGFILLVGGAIFGHDHDHDFGHDHDVEHDYSGHEHGGSQGVVSIFSMKVIGTLIMGFGGGGALARYVDWGWAPSSFVGVGVGILMAAFMYGILRLMYGHQANSLVFNDELIGKTGIVTIPITAEGLGSVSVSLGEQTPTYLARASNGKEISKGKTVKVVESAGSQLIVKEIH